MERVTMTVKELSSQLGISLRTAYELVKTPGFPSIRVGSKILIPIDAFREWLAGTMTGHPCPREDVTAWNN